MSTRRNTGPEEMEPQAENGQAQEEPEAAGPDDTSAKSAASYRGAMVLFWETMEALRDLADSMHPVLVDLDGYDRIGEELADELPREEQSSFLEFWASQKETYEDEDGRETEDSGEVQTSGETEKASEESETRDVRSDIREFASQLADLDTPGGHVALRLLERFVRRAPRSYFAYQSLLAMAVGAFEVLLGQVWSALFRDRPSMLGDNEKRFALADLAEFTTMEDAIEFAIEERVDSLLFQSLVEWKDWFAKHEITDFEKYAISWDSVQEAIQRRHVVVHNGGRVSRRYLEALPSTATQPELGQRLWTGASYLHNAIDELVVLGVIVAAATWRKVHREDGEHIAIVLLTEVAYPLLFAERWRAAAHMSKVAREIVSDGYTYWALQCNEWHARKMQSGIDGIREEVKAWNTSALAKVFVLVKHCLLEEMDAAFEALEGLLQEGALKEDDLREWPILAPVRNDPRYLLLRDESPESSDASSEEE